MEVTRSRRALLDAFRRVVAPELREQGFRGRDGHFVRRRRDIIHVIELQLSIYGGRVTANLGLDLPWLPPAIRWIDPPKLGPHAHDSTRWIRVGLTGPEPADRWWTFLSDAEEDQIGAARGVGGAILEHGIDWLDAEADRTAFLRHARERVDRSRSPSRPEGRFPELRLLAGVLAWNGRFDEAAEILELARAGWEDERGRLALARAEFGARYPGTPAARAAPDLVGELERLISPTTGEFVAAQHGPGRRAPRRRSPSERPG